ncbi:MAG: putative ABC exporter domain-containing protein [Vicinamibacterales bacterium]
MLGVTLFIVSRTAKNRFRQRLRRLREPRYLFGTIAGLVYLTFTLVIRARAYEVRGGSEEAASLFALMGPIVGGVGLAVLALASWVLPVPSTLLDFSKAEIAFLFPAPLSRGTLVLYRIVRSQVVVFTAALIMTLAYPVGSLPARARGLASVWLLLMTMRTFFAVVVLARSSGRGWSGVRAFGWPALLVPLAAVVSVSGPLFAAVADLARLSPLQVPGRLAEAIFEGAGANGASVWLTPFTALLTPLFSRSLTSFLAALPAAMALYALTVVWLVVADRASTEQADARAEHQVTSQPRAAQAYAARTAPSPLAWNGPPEFLFLWKASLQTWRTVDRRVVMRGLLILAWVVGASVLVTRGRSVALLVGVGATWAALFSVLMLPQILRMDLRQDLEHLALLRTWPVRGAALVRGQMLWPVLIVVLLAWFFGGLAMGASMNSASQIPFGNRVSAWSAFLLLAPGIVLAQYTVHNAIAVFFPGWIPIGPNRPRGVDAAGQRLLLLLGNWVGLLLALIPGALVIALLSFTLRRTLGPVVLPIGALVTTVAVFAEVWLVTEWLGRAWDQLDVTSVERPD